MKTKKLLCILMSVLVLLGALCACGKSGSGELTKLSVSEVTHSIFYAPQYAAIALGYFAEEGLDIELTNAGGADKVMAAVLSGDAQIGLAGPEQTIYLYNQGAKDYVINFAQLTKCDGSFLIAREKYDNFSVEDLRGSYIIGGRAGGMPVMVLEYILRQHGIEPNVDCIVDTSIAFNAISGAFIGGTGDFVSLFEPTASALEQAGEGYVVMSLGEVSGEIPYTVYNTSEAYAKANPEVIAGFTRAIERGLQYVAEHSAADVASVIAPYFADTSINDIAAVVERYKAVDAFAHTTELSEKAFMHLQDIISQYGELKDYVDYDILVDCSYKK